MSATFGRNVAAYRNELARSCGALLGIAQGILADGQLHDREVLFLRDWLENNQAVVTEWPGNVLAARIGEALVDGVITPQERAHLVQVLQDLVGGSFDELAEQTHVTALALDPVEAVTFDGRHFCLTGSFYFGDRATCAAAIERRGGLVTSSVSKKLHYVVVGGLGSPEWKHGSFGTKVEKAMQLKGQGAGLAVVHEDVWAGCLSRNGERVGG